MAGELGHARGRWRALTRQATFAQIAGRAEESARLGEQALELGLAIGELDAIGCFCTSRWSLVALGVREPATGMDAADPLWPMFPLLKAWPPAARGEAAEAAAALGDFSVLGITMWLGLEALAAAAVVFAVAGSDAQRAWVYEQLRPYAGTHVVVAAARRTTPPWTTTSARSRPRSGTRPVPKRTIAPLWRCTSGSGPPWTRLSEQALAKLPPANPAANELRLLNGVRSLSFQGKQVQLPDSKGLGDLAVLIDAHGADVHVLTLVGHKLARMGADPVLDERAKAAFKSRLDHLAHEIDDADAAGSPERAKTLQSERDALIHELAAAAGLGGRDRRLGDETERARKTVSARVRDACPRSNVCTLNWLHTCAVRCGWGPSVPIHRRSPRRGR